MYRTTNAILKVELKLPNTTQLEEKEKIKTQKVFLSPDATLAIFLSFPFIPS